METSDPYTIGTALNPAVKRMRNFGTALTWTASVSPPLSLREKMRFIVRYYVILVLQKSDSGAPQSMARRGT